MPKAFVLLTFDSREVAAKPVMERLEGLEGIESASLVTGLCDIIVETKDMQTDELHQFVVESLDTLPGRRERYTAIVKSMVSDRRKESR